MAYNYTLKGSLLNEYFLIQFLVLDLSLRCNIYLLVMNFMSFLGQKIKDTRLKTNCKVKLFKQTEELYRVCLEGSFENCRVAEKILLLSVRHNQNSMLINSVLAMYVMRHFSQRILIGFKTHKILTSLQIHCKLILN